jgi:hypothetical protein
MVTYKNWLHRLNKLPLNETNKTKELNTIINIAENNGYNRQQIMRIHNSIEQKRHQNNNEMKQKWVSFTFSGSYVRTITKLLKNTNIKIAFKTSHTIGKIHNERITTNKYEQTGIYSYVVYPKVPEINWHVQNAKKYTSDKQEEHSKSDIKNTFVA